MMYDLSGLHAGDSRKVMDDWKRLVRDDRVTQDKQYIHQDGKPVVVLWGLGFGSDQGRENLFEDGVKLIDFMKHDPACGGNTVMIGVPNQWSGRIGKGGDYGTGLQSVCDAADVIQPWAVGSYGTPDEAVRNANQQWTRDLSWCHAHHKEFMPVVFPGFSWHNLRHGKTLSDQIPRLGGRFLWTQYVQARRLNIPCVYQAMFDEVDEGTAIFKVTNDVPVPGKSVFVTYHGLPSDFYLRLVGEATRMIRGEMTPEQESLIREQVK